MAGRTHGILLTIEDSRNSINQTGITNPEHYQIFCESMAAAESALCAHACRNWNDEWGALPSRKVGGNIAPNRQAINRLYFATESGSSEEQTAPSGAAVTPTAKYTMEQIPLFSEERASAAAQAAGKPFMAKSSGGKAKAGVGSRSQQQ